MTGAPQLLLLAHERHAARSPTIAPCVLPSCPRPRGALRPIAYDIEPVLGTPHWRYVAAAPVVAVVAVRPALPATRAAPLPLVDPNLVAGRRFVFATGLAALLVALDILVRAARRSPSRRPS